MREIDGSFKKMNEKIILDNMLKRIADLLNRKREIENRIALAVKDGKRGNLLMTLPEINMYSDAVIISEINDISRFPAKEKFASYFGLVPRQALLC